MPLVKKSAGGSAKLSFCVENPMCNHLMSTNISFSLKLKSCILAKTPKQPLRLKSFVL